MKQERKRIKFNGKNQLISRKNDNFSSQRVEHLKEREKENYFQTFKLFFMMF